MILPGATLGVLGGGQLGRMFTMRAREMGYRVVVLDPDPDSPAGACGDEQLRAPYSDRSALAELAERCDAITTEFENVPADAMALLEAARPVRPGARAVAIAQDRIAEKGFVQEAGLRTAPFRAVHDAASARTAFAELGGGAALLKTARLGYDGKGQATVVDADGAAEAFLQFGGVPCVLERRLTLEREVSVVLARSTLGEIAAYPPGENVHVGGILHTTTLPATLSDAQAAEAVTLATRLADRLDYVGVLGVELFVAEGGQLFVNEMAPRPHNSGHWTLDAATCDQFEQQVRTLCGLPLGAPRLLTPACMVNLLGDLWADGEPRWAEALALPGVTLHLYGKRIARPGRKMGHLNCLAESAGAARALAHEALQRLQHG